MAGPGSSPLTRGKHTLVVVDEDGQRLIPAHAGKTADHTVAMGHLPGSSPLTRGKRYVLQGSARWLRLIPAHAGKTPPSWRSRPSARAHPRSRGENCYNVNGNKGVTGSSPLTRGKPSAVGVSAPLERLIPAHAGKTYSAHASPKPRPAHPRSRGENPDSQAAQNYDQGSSPLTRGKHDQGHGPWTNLRLIPAHAGKTPTRRARISSRAAHPRSRGENTRRASTCCSLAGSSPLTRGKLTLSSHPHFTPGLIPAHAGKTYRVIRPCCERWAHPRSRGENTPASWDDPLACGSSPLTRGKLGFRRTQVRGSRLIPAHAGKTHPTHRGRRPDPAHPRSRGENYIIPKSIAADPGSSPLTRGKPLAISGLIPRYGLIPAHAGKTARAAATPSRKPAHPRSRGENPGW